MTLFLSDDFGMSDIRAGTIYGAWGASITVFGVSIGVGYKFLLFHSLRYTQELTTRLLPLTYSYSLVQLLTIWELPNA